MTTSGPPTDALHEALALVAPGTPLRDGIERIVRAKMGALADPRRWPRRAGDLQRRVPARRPVQPAAAQSSWPRWTARSSSARTDSALARANVHLVPDPTVPTSETGTRHRTAERVARSIPVPVVSVSEEMGVINVYAGGMQAPAAGHQPPARSGQPGAADARALQGPPRRRAGNLTALELEDVATIRDVAAVVQRGEMVRRISAEIETMIVELGVDARLLHNADEIAVTPNAR